MLTYWIPEGPCMLPTNATHQVGVGGFVINDKNEVWLSRIRDVSKLPLVTKIHKFRTLNLSLAAICLGFLRIQIMFYFEWQRSFWLKWVQFSCVFFHLACCLHVEYESSPPLPTKFNIREMKSVKHLGCLHLWTVLTADHLIGGHKGIIKALYLENRGA